MNPFHPTSPCVTELLTSIYDGLVGDLQHETELGVHGVGLFGMDSKEGCIKVANVLQFTVPLWKTVQTWNRESKESRDIYRL